MLDSEVKQLRSRAYAEATKSTYRSQLQSYLKFCEHVQYQAVPTSPDNLLSLLRLVVLKITPDFYKQYLNVVRLLHLESGFSNPLADNWILKTLLKGIDRDKGREVFGKLPVTPEILRNILNVVNLKDSRKLTFWTFFFLLSVV